MKQILDTVAGLMALAARTAPKTAGKDFINISVLNQDEIDKLVVDMKAYETESRKQKFCRDAENVANSDAVVLISLSNSKTAGLNCGACGSEECRNLNQGVGVGPEFSGPWCAWRLVDLGIALGSAVKSASIHNADNRIMYRIGVSARRLGMIEGEVVVGIPISAKGKNIYFDRG